MKTLIATLLLAAAMAPTFGNIAHAYSCNTYCYWVGDSQYCNTRCY